MGHSGRFPVRPWRRCCVSGGLSPKPGGGLWNRSPASGWNNDGPDEISAQLRFWINLSGMTITRRRLVYLAGGAWASRMLGQSGVASRGLRQQARPAPSGRPFYAPFFDVAASAGLTSAVIYGGVDNKQYILEADGCGCAFLDFDNDGWMDIFLLTGQ